MNITINWKGKLAFEGESPSGFPVHMDSHSGHNEGAIGPSPMELIAFGLAGCTAMDVISILKKKRQDVTRFDVTMDAPRSHEFPKVFTKAVLKYIFSGKDLSKDAILRAIELSVDKYCPAHAMLEKAFPIDIHYEIHEDGGDENQSPVYQGVWRKVTED